ncbi:MAG: coenzyme F420-0:L-glutamate ligase [Candidatus Kariarchaeaceae archaeon]|jgi:coenzyme F420-0:L-glutamate ligase/coenzyme F420-1:gamma-L-glutamate ligase
MLSIFPVTGIAIINSKHEFFAGIDTCAQNLQADDILVVAHTPWSRAMDLVYTLSEVTPSHEAKKLADELEKDARHIEVILRESNEIVKYGNRVLITENKAGIVCANAGIDQSNAGIGKAVAVPHDPDAVAREIRQYILDKFDITVAVIMSDTVGRALRNGAVNIGIGVAGIKAMRSEIGRQDLFGYTLRVSEVALADEIASAAELAQGQADEGTPFVIVRGLSYERIENDSARKLNRPRERRLFQ